MISHDFVPTLTVKDVKVTKPPAQNSVGILVPGLGVGWSATFFLQHLASTTSVDILPSLVRHNAHTFMVVPSPDLCLRHGCLCSPHDGFANVTPVIGRWFVSPSPSIYSLWLCLTRLSGSRSLRAVQYFPSLCFVLKSSRGRLCPGNAFNVPCLRPQRVLGITQSIVGFPPFDLG